MRINMREVITGMELNAPVIVGNNLLLVQKGEKLTPELISSLRRFHVTEIDIVPIKDMEEGKPKKIIENDFEFTINDNLVKKVSESLTENNIDKINTSAADMVKSILEKLSLSKKTSNFKYDLKSYNYSNDLIHHSIRVASFSIVLAHLYNEQLKATELDEDKLKDSLINLQDISVAALLHDRGKNAELKDVSDSISTLKNNDVVKTTMPGFEEVPTDKIDDKYSTVYSFCLINNLSSLSTEAKYMVLFSEETENSNGPLKATSFDKDNKINFVVGAKIIHLCSLYDNILSHCIQTNLSFENVVALLGQCASQGVTNEELTKLFLSNIPIYSAGNKVELSDGQTAIVIASFDEYAYITRPIVMTTTNGKIIDLRKETSLTIKGISKENKDVDELAKAQLNEVDFSRK